MDKKEVLARFRVETAEHRMEIIKDDGLHRHLRFRKPGTYCMGFDIVTWPGYLAITGDMGASVFSRLEDMFQFFRASERSHAETDGLYINRSYWAEKLVANDGEAKEFEEDRFTQYVKDIFDQHIEEKSDDDGKAPAWAGELWEDIESELLSQCVCDTGQALGAMQDFKPDSNVYGDFTFGEVWESALALEDYTWHLIWRMYAVAYAVLAYDAAKTEVAVPA